MRDVFIFAGQSNMESGGKTITLLNSGLTVDPGDPGDAPDYVPSYAITAVNQWTGASPASPDSGVQYEYPTTDNAPCLYVGNNTGQTAGVFDSWGSHVLQSPTDGSGGLGVSGTYGPELSFLYRHLATYSGTPIGCVKQVLGGSSLRSNWLPNTVAVGTAQAGSSTSITLAAGEFRDPSVGNLVIRVVSGTGAGSVGVCTAYDSGTKVATVAGGWSGASPDGGSTYGIEMLQGQILRTMLEQAEARLDADDGPGNWRWAGFLWWQGEAGAHSAGTAADDSEYLSDARALFAWVRSLCGRADLPVLVGRIHDAWGWESSPNPYLDAAGYPYAAIDGSYWFSHSPFDGDGRRAAPSGDRADYLAGAAARRATQVTLGGDQHCAWWDNDGLPPYPPFWPEWATYWGEDVGTTGVGEAFAYHLSGPAHMAVGERAFGAYQSLVGRPVRPGRIRAGGGRLRIRAGGA